MTGRRFDVVVIGAGAAGLMAAATAGARGRRVLVLDHARAPGAKILISGGGRCNFTHLDCAHTRFHSDNPDFARSALSRYTPRDFVSLVDRHGIAWHEKSAGQLFCDGSARAIVDMLLAECAAAGVAIETGRCVADVIRTERFRIETDMGEVDAASLILATGGLSIPKLGASGFAYRIAGDRFGLPIVPTRPALVPFTTAPDTLGGGGALAGVSLEATAACGTARFEDGIVFTHRGLSGPAMLQVSSAWREGGAVRLDLIPRHRADALLAGKRARPRAALATLLSDLVPRRLADAILALPPDGAPDGAPDGDHAPDTDARPAGEISDRTLAALGARLKSFSVTPSGTEGYAKAEVTLGGVCTSALSQRTLEARAVPGLFVVGEAVDMTGWLGGHYFQWAWSSGVAAGEAA